jgi:hypothetical protein
MNLSRRTHREDALFVIALLVPAIFATARYFQSDRDMIQIAQAQASSVVVQGNAPAPLIVAAAQIEQR